ncbi:hypothetical protein RP20_CCG023549 [Aedes albopictus]|nr:hypothetical protein RP20_CCG023549 [Aedes albopictus]
MSESTGESFGNSSFFRDPQPLLSGRDMLQHHVGNYDFYTRIRLVQPEEEIEQRENIARIQDEFRTVLAQQRVAKGEAYSEGEWDNDRKRVRIRKAVGKWHIYGYQEDQIRYVDGYEALHLLEMAYSLFLGYPDSLSLEQYKVYSTMMRAGFYLLKSDSNRKYQIETGTVERDLDEEHACVWRNLYRILRQPNPLVEQSEQTDRALAEKVQQSMQNFNSMIALQSGSNDEVESTNGDDNTQKRKTSNADQELPPKRQRTDETASWEPKNALQSKINNFADLFESFEIVQSTIGSDVEAVDYDPNVQLHFDVFFSSDGTTFRRSQPIVPEYRIIIRLSSEPLLTGSDIASLYHRQPKPEVPILFMQVAETLSIHCFMYSFYRLPKNLVVIPARRTTKKSDDDVEELADSDSSCEEDETQFWKK